jgi:hypothetical protein
MVIINSNFDSRVTMFGLPSFWPVGGCNVVVPREQEKGTGIFGPTISVGVSQRKGLLGLFSFLEKAGLAPFLPPSLPPSSSSPIGYTKWISKADLQHSISSKLLQPSISFLDQLQVKFHTCKWVLWVCVCSVCEVYYGDYCFLEVVFCMESKLIGVSLIAFVWESI